MRDIESGNHEDTDHYGRRIKRAEMNTAQRIRSLLYAPGNDRRKVLKAAESNADAVCLDLEDAVPSYDKDDALRSLDEILERAIPDAHPRLCVRPNGWRTGRAEREIQALIRPNLWGLALTKVETLSGLDRLLDAVHSAEASAGVVTGATRLIVSIDNPQLVLDLPQIARREIFSAVIGGMDFAVNIGTNLSPEMTESAWARSLGVIALRAAGKPGPIHPPCMNIRDEERLRLLMTQARNLGFQGGIALHPAQIDTINRAFSPSATEIEAARETLRVLATGNDHGGGVGMVGDEFVDEAMAKRARDILNQAQEAATATQSRQQLRQ